MTRITGNGTGGLGEDANRRSKGPVVLQHGNFYSGEKWYENALGNGDKSPAAQLYDAGYDVFIMAWRATTDYNRGHVDPLKDAANYPGAYYDFDESTIAENEIPAVVNKVLEVR